MATGEGFLGGEKARDVRTSVSFSFHPLVPVIGLTQMETRGAWQYSPQGKPSVQFSHSVVSDSLWSHGLQHARLPYPSPTPRTCSSLCPSSRWCYPITSSSLISFSSHLQSLPASGSFPRSQFFASGGQSIGVSASASVLSMNIQDWFPLELTGWISLQSRGFSSLLQHHSSKASVIQCSAFFIVPTLISIHDYWKNHSLD